MVDKNKINEYKELNRNKLLYEVILHRYDEEERRFRDIKEQFGRLLSINFLSYISIVFIFSLNSTINLLTVFLFFVSFVCLNVSCYYFIKAYAFEGKFKQVPGNNYVIKRGKEETNELTILREMIANLNEVIPHNSKIMADKIRLSQKGTKYLIVGFVVMCLFIFVG